MNKNGSYAWVRALIYASLAFLGLLIVFKSGACVPPTTGFAYTGSSRLPAMAQTPAYSPEIQLGRWVTESLGTMDLPARFGDRPLRLDVDGHIHIVFGGRQLIYAMFDGATWFTGTVDVSAVRLSHASLALDDQGQPHVSYFDEATQATMYAQLTESGWQTETIELLDGVAQDGSLALDSTGAPHVSYTAVISEVSAAYYAYRTGDAWVVELVDNDTAGDIGAIGGPTSLVLDSQEYPHLVYAFNGINTPRTGTAIRHAYWDGSQWQIEIAGGHYAAYSQHLAIDASDILHLGYAGTTGYYVPAVSYAVKSGDSWTVEVIEDTAWWYPGAAVALFEEQPLIAFLDYFSLRFAYKEQSAWHFSTVDTVTGNGLAIDVNQSGRPVILYTDNRDTRINIARQIEPAWLFIPIAFQ